MHEQSVIVFPWYEWSCINFKQQQYYQSFYHSMSTRSQPYRRKMPMHILPLIKVAMRITLYMVSQSGPTSFTFKDRLGAKHKVSIGSSINCTCQMRANDHCIHSMYVLLRIFKMSIENQLIWQNSYIDSELQDIVSGKYSVGSITRPAISQTLIPSLDFMQPTKVLQELEPQVQRMVLGQESECPICQQPMSKEMCLTYCKVGCGNNFHINCLKIWIEHKQSTQGRVTCPMCRCQYSQRRIEAIKAEEHKYMQEQQRIKIKSMKFSCQSCGRKSLTGELYKCLFCQNYCLCPECFLLKKHIKHPFIKFNGEEWQGAQQRREQNKKLKEFLQQKRKQKYNTDEIIEKIKRINLEPAKILDFVASCYPYVSQYITEKIDPLKKLDFRPQDVVCFSCGSMRITFMRRLPCGHFIDHNCLKEFIVKRKFHCEKDGSKFLKGYENLLKIQEDVLTIVPAIQREKPQVPARRPPSLDTYNFRIAEEIEEAQNQQTLLSILGGHQTVRQSINQQPFANRIEQNLTRHVIRPPQPVVNSGDNNIRIRNLSLNPRKPPSVENKKRRPSIIQSHLTIQGQTMRRNNN